MVFDWFQRRLAKEDTTAPPPPEPAAPVAPPADSADAVEASGLPAADAADVAATAPAPPAVEPASSQQASPQGASNQTASPQPASPQPAAPSVPGIDSDALAWAREAYARLKAEQQAALQAEAEPPATEPSAPEPRADSSPPVPEAVAPDLPVVSPDLPAVAPDLPAAVQTAPEPRTGPEPVAEAPAAPLSLLERAAAERQLRQRELLAPEVSAEPVVPETPRATEASPSARTEEAIEPRLGDFDAVFTWSAEVLAAQGRRPDQVTLEEIDWLTRLRRGLEKTRRGFVSQLLETLGDDPLTPEVLDNLESSLLRADVGVKATEQVIEALRARLNQEVVEASEGLRFLKEQLRELLEEPIQASGQELLVPERDRLNIWLMVGVNGVGKTTTLGKLANLAVRSGYTCLIAAADTFRAAAVEQVRIWGERSAVPVIANPSPNADPAAVVYDAIGAAKANGTELVLVDTAGRLQTKHNLMEELSKVRRIVDKLAPEAAVESLLVLDASQGQNGLRQAMAFAKAAGLTGVVITKLDGSSRGGVAVAVCREVGLPIRFIGAGEGLRDLRPFNSYEFVEALLAT
jgi:fused signal recognition particle receptor